MVKPRLCARAHRGRLSRSDVRPGRPVRARRHGRRGGRRRAVALPPLNDALARDLVSRTRVPSARRLPRSSAGESRCTVRGARHAFATRRRHCPRSSSSTSTRCWSTTTARLALDARIQWRGGTENSGSLCHPALSAGSSRSSVDLERSRAPAAASSTGRRPGAPQFLDCLTERTCASAIFHARPRAAAAQLARLTQIDYDREMSFVAIAADAEGKDERSASCKQSPIQTTSQAEFAIVVRSDLKGQGLGPTPCQADRLLPGARNSTAHGRSACREPVDAFARCRIWVPDRECRPGLRSSGHARPAARYQRAGRRTRLIAAGSTSRVTMRRRRAPWPNGRGPQSDTCECRITAARSITATGSTLATSTHRSAVSWTMTLQGRSTPSLSSIFKASCASDGLQAPRIR